MSNSTTMAMKDIDKVRGEVATLVSQTVRETFQTMFGQNVQRHEAGWTGGEFSENAVYASIRLHQGDESVEFCFRFDFNLLLQAAELIFSKEYLDATPVHEELASEIANIVCSKVKAFLNEQGFETEMGFPFIPRPDENPLLSSGEMIHMHFYYPGPGGENDIGVSVNLFVDGKPVVRS
ncbi:MAG: hypothetical protein GC185_11230 [Alphaproteobacteria bacterium]|nr:hypothetical protein [Alphaproteobacteria bacterium]